MDAIVPSSYEHPLLIDILYRSISRIKLKILRLEL